MAVSWSGFVIPVSLGAVCFFWAGAVAMFTVEKVGEASLAGRWAATVGWVVLGFLLLAGVGLLAYAEAKLSEEASDAGS